jgi:hypothetical protein
MATELNMCQITGLLQIGANSSFTFSETRETERTKDLRPCRRLRLNGNFHNIIKSAIITKLRNHLKTVADLRGRLSP